MLYAMRQLVGPFGVTIDAGAPIPESWSQTDPFVVECVQHGYIADLDAAPTQAPVADPTVVEIGGQGRRKPHAEGAL